MRDQGNLDNTDNPEDSIPINPTSEDFIPEDFLESRWHDVKKNHEYAVILEDMVSPEDMGSVDVELIKKVRDLVDSLIYVLAFPIDDPYLVKWILICRQEGIVDPKSISEYVTISLLDEEILHERNPFDSEDEVGIPLFLVMKLGFHLNRYVALALENIDDHMHDSILTQILRANFICCLLLSDATNESMVRKNIEEGGDPRVTSYSIGDQKILVKKAGLYAVLRVLESACRMIEAGLWKMDLYWDAAFRREIKLTRDAIATWEREHPEKDLEAPF